jgi:hypothetical protein
MARWRSQAVRGGIEAIDALVKSGDLPDRFAKRPASRATTREILNIREIVDALRHVAGLPQTNYGGSTPARTAVLMEHLELTGNAEVDARMIRAAEQRKRVALNPESVGVEIPELPDPVADEPVRLGSFGEPITFDPETGLLAAPDGAVSGESIEQAAANLSTADYIADTFGNDDEGDEAESELLQGEPNTGDEAEGDDPDDGSRYGDDILPPDATPQADNAEPARVVETVVTAPKTREKAAGTGRTGTTKKNRNYVAGEQAK